MAHAVVSLFGGIKAKGTSHMGTGHVTQMEGSRFISIQAYRLALHFNRPLLTAIGNGKGFFL